MVTGATIIECSKIAFLFDVGIWHFQPIHVVAYAKDKHYEGAYWGLQVPRYSQNSLVRYLVTTIYSILRSTSLDQNFLGVFYDNLTFYDIVKFSTPKSV